MTSPANLLRLLSGNNVTLMMTVPQTEQDETWMAYAIQLALKANTLQEVPVGAVVVAENEIIGEGFNQSILSNDPTAHAEIIALRDACEKIANYRLVNATLYVTLEPCVMCTGALIHARIRRLVFGASDQKRGAIHSQCQLADLPSNHNFEFQGGILADQCLYLLQDFFRKRR